MLTVHLHTFAMSMLASHVFCSECIPCAYANKERPYQLPSCTLLQDICLPTGGSRRQTAAPSWPTECKSVMSVQLTPQACPSACFGGVCYMDMFAKQQWRFCWLTG
jgi:hypothetical protein